MCKTRGRMQGRKILEGHCGRERRGEDLLQELSTHGPLKPGTGPDRGETQEMKRGYLDHNIPILLQHTEQRAVLVKHLKNLL